MVLFYDWSFLEGEKTYIAVIGSIRANVLTHHKGRKGKAVVPWKRKKKKEAIGGVSVGDIKKLFHGGLPVEKEREGKERVPYDGLEGPGWSSRSQDFKRGEDTRGRGGALKVKLLAWSRRRGRNLSGFSPSKNKGACALLRVGGGGRRGPIGWGKRGKQKLRGEF